MARTRCCVFCFITHTGKIIGLITSLARREDLRNFAEHQCRLCGKDAMIHGGGWGETKWRLWRTTLLISS